MSCFKFSLKNKFYLIFSLGLGKSTFYFEQRKNLTKLKRFDITICLSFTDSNTKYFLFSICGMTMFLQIFIRPFLFQRFFPFTQWKCFQKNLYWQSSTICARFNKAIEISSSVGLYIQSNFTENYLGRENKCGAHMFACCS